jgi:hypothetical protein
MCNRLGGHRLLHMGPVFRIGGPTCFRFRNRRPRTPSRPVARARPLHSLIDRSASGYSDHAARICLPDRRSATGDWRAAEHTNSAPEPTSMKRDERDRFRIKPRTINEVFILPLTTVWLQVGSRQITNNFNRSSATVCGPEEVSLQHSRKNH